MGESSGRTQSHSHTSNERVPGPSSQEIIPSEPDSQIVRPRVYSPTQRELSLGSDGKNVAEEESEVDSDESSQEPLVEPEDVPGKSDSSAEMDNESDEDEGDGETSEEDSSGSENEVIDSLREPDATADVAKLCREGGVGLIKYLLMKAIPPIKEDRPSKNVREWTYKDINCLPPDERKEWLRACEEELEALRRHEVFELVDLPEGFKVLKNRWVFDEKSDGRKKGRLVVKGYGQEEGIDSVKLFSPVVHFETVRLMLALAALEGWHIEGLDVRNAYLYGELDEEIYMTQPEGFAVKGQERKVLRLRRALYGLKQAGLAWWRALDKYMKLMGFIQLTSDAGLFLYKTKEGFVLVIIYVDDALFCGKSKPLVAKMKAKFMQRWECRDLGESSEFLRMRIQRLGNKIKIDQCPYLNKLLVTCGMENAKSAPTPLPAGYIPKPNDGESTPALRSRYQTVIGSLLYIMLGTRPDISFAVTKLAQYASNPSQDHLNKALYVCRYLIGSKDYSLVYDGDKGLGLTACTDSDWASDPHTRCSQTGFFLKLAGGIFSWTSRAQKTIAHSATEA